MEKEEEKEEENIKRRKGAEKEEEEEEKKWNDRDCMFLQNLRCWLISGFLWEKFADLWSREAS